MQGELIINLYLLFAVSSAAYITIDDVDGSNSSACLKSLQACKSLEYVSHHLKDVSTGNITLKIVSSSLTVREVVSFTGIDGLTLLGHGMESTLITCLTGTSKKGTGLRFYNCSRLTLANFTINNCGYQIDPKSLPLQYGAISVKNSSNVEVLGLNITNSTGRGLAMTDLSGTITVSECLLLKNGHSNVTDIIQGGMVLSMTKQAHHASMDISNCLFVANRAVKVNGTNEWKVHEEHGGGLLLLLQKSSYNRINLTGCLFVNNSAPMAAGLKISVIGGEGNNIQVTACNFSNNTASLGGGGGDIGFGTFSKSENAVQTPNEYIQGATNNISLVQCNFYNNMALFGGALALYAAVSNGRFENDIRIEYCNFFENKADGGSAVNINRDIRQIDGPSSNFECRFMFDSCSFESNHAGRDTNNKASAAEITQTGTLFTSLVPVFLLGNNTFHNNNGTAIYSSAATINFTEGSLTNFSSNIGEKGGAILLVGTARLNIEPDSSLYFENNKASFGGAICNIQLETQYFGYTEICLIASQKPCTINFIFKDNLATSGIANDIFLANVKECQSRCNLGNPNELFTTQCLGNMSFSSSHSNIASVTQTIETDSIITPYPGVIYKLNITQRDVFGNDVSQLFPLTVSFMAPCGIHVDPGFVILTNNYIKLYGQPGFHGTLILQGYTNTNVQVSTHVRLSQCSPGYVLNNDTCVCSADNDKTRLEGIISCSNNTAILQPATWAGYLNSSGKERNKLVTGNCKVGLCNSRRQQKINKDLSYICYHNREGVLCSRCKANYTLQYHSNTYLCKEIGKSHCKYGILLYLVSELLPVTIIFMIILILNVNITSGAVNTFIFCAQVLSSLFIDGFEVIKADNRVLSNFFLIYRLLAGFLNLSILEFDRFSFCLFKGTNIMTLFVVKYFTVLYAFFLIVITIIVLRLNSLYSCIKLCYKCGRRNIRTSIINGLTAFLILCYFQCVKVTFNILIPSSLRGAGGKVVTTRVFFAGDIEYMSFDHLPYAIPAIICLVVVILPPPIILSLEPLLVRLSGAVNIRRNAFTFCLHRLRMKLKPFLDSFQGCFRDNCRSFSGLFFFYRIIVLAPAVYSDNIELSYLQATVILFSICILHGLTRPYQTKWHNYVDFLLLGNITAVTMLTAINVSVNYSPINHSIQKRSILICQVILVSFSLVYIFFYFAYYILRKCKFSSRLNFVNLIPLTLSMNRSASRETLIDESLPARLYEDSMAN